MKLRDLATRILSYDSNFGIWAELIDGEFNLDSDCRIGQFQFDKGGLLDDFKPFASNKEIENFVYCYWDDCSEPEILQSEDPAYNSRREEAISELIYEKNQVLELD